jgi:phosphate-selective porin OprO and OprP
LTGLPWYDEEAKGRRLVHLGLAGSYIVPEENQVRFRARPEANLAPRFVDTGTMAAEQAYLLGAEAALVYGPFSLQSEYIRTWVDAMVLPDVSFDGFYVFGSLFLTGEHRGYRRSSGGFDRVRPRNNFGFGEDEGWGAWEMALRYSRLHLNDRWVSGGTLADVTAGVNWYLNPNARVTFNYIYADVERQGHNGEAHVFQTRLQVDF